jgi:zinc and cadmium transporter
MILYPFIAALAVMMVSLAGIIFTSRKLGSWMERNLPFLATFSIGIFSVITWGLFEESLLHDGGLIIVLSIAAGALLVHLLAKIIPDAHHHHDPHTGHSHSHIDARRLLLGDAMHNIGDGLLLVPAFMVSTGLGIATTVGVLLHELVQEISEFFILKEAGYSTKKALIRNFISSSTIFIGVGLSASLASIEMLEAPLIGLAAGGFMFVILRDLVPHTVSSIREKGRGDKHIQALVFGVLIMLGVNIALPHTHEEHTEEVISETIAHEI